MKRAALNFGLSTASRYNAGMLQRLGPHAANALTASRVLLTPAFAGAVWCADAHQLLRLAAVATFCIVAASDVVDGRVARRFGSASSAGRAFDHYADIGFILIALSAYVGLGLVPWWVPAAIAGSFAFYVFDSWLRTGPATPSLIGSRIGHVGGVCNYVLVGVLVFNNTAQILLLPAAVLHLLFWLVPVYSAAAVVSRLAAQRLAVSIPEAA